MGKRIDQLPVDDTPFEDDPRETSWGRFLAEIDSLLATGDYTWARDTLEGIQETVERTHTVSPRQRLAVENIEAGRATRRPYAGYRRRYR